jgi:hypothetical protein
MFPSEQTIERSPVKAHEALSALIDQGSISERDLDLIKAVAQWIAQDLNKINEAQSVYEVGLIYLQAARDMVRLGRVALSPLRQTTEEEEEL